jgi:hypothetical protein
VTHSLTQYHHDDYQKYCYGLGIGSIFFQYLYAIVPSVFGNSKGGLQKDELTPDVLDEIDMTRRCRQLSAYTQVATLLSTCQTSRLTALDYLKKMIFDGAWPIYRSGGPLYRTRPLQTWKQQYQQCQNFEVVLQEADKLLPTICGPLDLVVYRLHTTSGYPKETLKHTNYQMAPSLCQTAIPFFDRIGIEWHPLWATTEGRKELCASDIGKVVLLASNRSSHSTQLYWLVDGIPRPQWDRYPAAIPTAFSRVIEHGRDRILRYWQTDKAWKSRLLKYHDLNQEFEANGRRYYVVFVISQYDCEYHLEESFRDPAVSWDGPFPGGEDLWPKALRDPVRVAYEVQTNIMDHNLWTDTFCSYVLSWEPI